ncbi:1,2-phenylacetyl-CoA epoxidase subunit PaaC [Kitasatospora sp. LaBMicrA B282]|uniref:1,2-phenylacetyl-CoA epoxidase subunit PaaC n=1 Tax=Kitasatospora sp. LaBMicrA B282 TaxID=3420949 RepID=UPI003D0AF6BC
MTDVTSTALAGSTSSDPGLARRVLALGDDALILAQRLCAWITRAPTIEEDLALSNIALDLLGHARVLLTLSGRLDGSGRTEDQLAYLRDGREFRNTLLTELPGGDFATTIARQLLYSHYARLHYAELAGCAVPELAAFAARAATEVDYHRAHADGWTLRLGLGTAESRRRMQEGLDLMWPYAAELFEGDLCAADGPTANSTTVPTTAGRLPAPGAVRERWQQQVTEVLTRAGLHPPQPSWAATGGRDGRHSEEFGVLLAELQSVHRQFPGGSW